MTIRYAFALVFLVSGTVTSCDRGPAGPRDEGLDFNEPFLEAELSGGRSGTIRARGSIRDLDPAAEKGRLAYGVRDLFGSAGVTAVLGIDQSAPDSAGAVVLLIADPQPGTYSITRDCDPFAGGACVAAALEFTDGTDPEGQPIESGYRFHSGRLTITGASDERIAGTFQGIAGAEGSAAANIEVTAGRFGVELFTEEELKEIFGSGGESRQSETLFRPLR